jgi:Uma2 family endonuclease
MSTTVRRVHHTYAEYLALEDASPIRHEYLDGEIYAMAGGTPDHAALAARAIGLLTNRLPPDCRIFTSDLRVRIASSGLSTYPDAAIVCGRTLRAPDDPIAIVNPVLLIEVTSPSTEEYDRGEKLRHYQHLPSLREVLILSHREPRVTRVRRGDGDEWTTRDFVGGQAIDLLTPSGTLLVDELYRDGLEDV